MRLRQVVRLGAASSLAARPSRRAGRPSAGPRFATLLARHAALPPAAVRSARPVTPAPAAATGAGEAIVAAAQTQLGGAYVWGGERPGAFDCSGLVRWAVRQATGQTLPRVAADQAGAGRPVGRDGLRPGDLVFFRDTSQPGISHVGIYQGAGRFVHAASERQGIIVSRLDEPYWAAHYAGARRLTE